MPVSMSFDHCVKSAMTGWFTPKCLSVLTAGILGYVIIAAAFLLKLPQLYKIRRSRSTAGVSDWATYLEVLYFTLMSAYSHHAGHPFYAYGENLVAAVQCFLQCLLIWHLQKTSLRGILQEVTALGVCWCLPLYFDLLPEFAWGLVPLLSIGMHASFKGPQLLENRRNQSTGQLALATVVLYTLWSALRLYTWFLQRGEWPLLVNFLVATVLNLALCVQFALYWKNELHEKKTN